MTKEEQLKTAHAACMQCRQCSLCATRTHLVYGAGSPEARLMFVGEAPGEREDATGIPFVGPAGQLFDRFLYAVDLRREDIYIANILKCRPPHNRDPLPEEEEACIGNLREQVRILRPAILVCLGRIAAGRLIHPGYRITREHGIFVERGSFSLTAVYHPSALLRDPSKREDMLADMQEIARRYRALSEAD